MRCGVNCEYRCNISKELYSFLTVRVESSRLPRKCFLEFGSTTLLEHVILRTQYYGFQPVISTTSEPSDDEIQDFCSLRKIPFFRGSSRNKLMRWRDTAEYFGIRQFHTIDVDDPFFAGEMVMESMALLESKESDVVFPTYDSQKGSAAVGYSIRASSLNQLLEETVFETDTEMVDTWFNTSNYLHAETLVSAIQDLPNARLTLDYEEDYYMLKQVLSALGPFCSRSEIVNFLKSNPDVVEINAFRTVDWQNRQQKQRKVGHV